MYRFTKEMASWGKEREALGGGQTSYYACCAICMALWIFIYYTHTAYAWPYRHMFLAFYCRG